METSVKERSKKIPVVIPHVKGFSEQMRLVFGKYGIPTYFKPTNTLPQLFVKPKDSVSKENVVGPVPSRSNVKSAMCMLVRQKDP